MAVIKLYDMKAAAVYVEVYVAFFQIRCNGFPKRYLGIKLFYFASGSVADSFTVGLWEEDVFIFFIN